MIRLKKKMTSQFQCSCKGFSLVELMIVLVIGSVISISLYSAYKYQQTTQVVQDNVVEMQQNLRSSSFFMLREMRMAGFDPQGKAESGIIKANRGVFQFTQDIFPDTGPGDGDVDDANENITFRLSDDADENGVADNGVCSLERVTGGVTQPIADNIRAIEFWYTLKDGTQTLSPLSAQYNQIRTVTISILAESPKVVLENTFRNTVQYESASTNTWGSPYNDRKRRRLMIMNVNLRNMGL